MCAKFGCGPTVVSKGGGYRQTDKGTLQLYIVDVTYVLVFFATLTSSSLIDSVSYSFLSFLKPTKMSMVFLTFVLR